MEAPFAPPPLEPGNGGKVTVKGTAAASRSAVTFGSNGGRDGVIGAAALYCSW